MWIKWPDFPSLKHLERACDSCCCQIFVLEGRVKHTHAVVYHDLIISPWSQRVGVGGMQLFKTIFTEIRAIYESKTAARCIVGTEMGIPACLIRQPAAADKNEPGRSSGGKLHLQAVYAPVVGLGRKKKKEV